MNWTFQDLINIKSDSDFERLTLDIYNYQSLENPVYRNFVNQLNRTKVSTHREIPFLPIAFFKTHDVACKQNNDTFFLSSGTGNVRSKHHIYSLKLYEDVFVNIFEKSIGKLQNMVILALLPNYLEQGNSSLIYMLDKLIQHTENELSGFVLNDLQTFKLNYQKAVESNKKLVIFGVSYALLDLAEQKVDLSEATIIETGGMKGRRKELSKEELHDALKVGFGVDYISSEYGMAELMSQAYSKKDGVFEMQAWFKLLTREVNDPFSLTKEGKTGGLNVIDLANTYSCSFIATQDLGSVQNNTFKLSGRFDNADIRGCNLMIE